MSERLTLLLDEPAPARPDTWDRTVLDPTPSYQGLVTGDTVHVQWFTNDPPMRATVTGTCTFGALVLVDGYFRPFEMYVRHRNQHGAWYR
ncbi:hypothetical protein [Kitasatospora sp. NPDC088548]|uniref:hypothetical protein n=1 Tax=Kitasatospora sp. NPDC088548 TaxID=3364075 RepID=UPI0038261BA1